ncbi:MAG: hypothetical protein C0599_15000, partial [Salinivirgaceae bacterium]
YSVNWEGDNICLKFFGVLKLRDLQEANGLIYADKRFDRMKYQIADFTEADTVGMKHTEVVLVSHLDKTATTWNPSVKVACVSPDEKTDRLIKEYISIMGSTSWKCKLFHNIQEAEKWCQE